MVSTTSGTTTFSLDVDEIIEQAISPIGGEHQSSEDLEKAKRTLNLVLIMLQNKEIPLSKLSYVTQVLTASEPSYTLNSNIIDVLACNIDDETSDLEIDRYSLQQYQDLPNKTTENRPNTFLVQRNRDAVNMTFWPVPNDAVTYTAKMLVSQKVEDITASYQKVDISTRYLPLLVAWLSYELAKNKPGIDENTKNRLKADYIELLPDTIAEDRERTDIVIRPGGISGR